MKDQKVISIPETTEEASTVFQALPDAEVGENQHPYPQRELIKGSKS